ncbi:MAG: hypothetical protein IJ555_07990, partial [Ruminococcus sp.]|nr:hypothetical protein [Ruminococcus sp.]
NICFLIVVFDLKLYLRVVTIINSNMSFLPCVLLTLAGAKFVIDGPDLVVKIIGIDAGVKSGAATIMALRSGSQMFTDAGNKIRSIAHIPTKVAAAAGHVSAAVKDINSAEGPVNKIRAAAANTAPGQAFRSSEMQQDNVNENYASRRDNEFKGPGGTQMKRKDPAAPGSSPQSPSSGSSDGGSPQRSNDQQDHGRYGPSASYQFGAAYGRTVAAARNKIVDSANNLIDDVEQKGMVRAAADRAVSAAVKPVADTVHSLYQGAAEGYDSNKSRDKFGRRADAPSMGNTMTSVETSPQANNISAVSVSGSTENNNVTATANVQLSKNENNTNNTAANAIDQAAAMANETVNITEHHAASVSVTNTHNTANTFANTVNQSVNSGSVPGRVEVNGVNGINGNDGMNGKNGMDGPDAADAEQPPPTHFDFEVYSKPPETAEPPKKNDE